MTFRPNRRDEQRVVMHLGQRAHKAVGDFRFIDMDARADDRRIHNRLVADFGTTHQYGIFEKCRRMELCPFLHTAVYKNHAIINVRRFFKASQHDRIANF